MSDINNGGFSARAKIVTDDKSPGGSFSTSAKVVSSANNIAGDLLTIAQGKANYSGDGSTTAFFTGLDIASASKISVYVNGVYQFTGTYSFLNGLLTFTEAPPIGTDNIEVQYIYGVETVSPDSEGTITSTSFNSRFLSGDDTTTLFDIGVNLLSEYKCIVFIDGIYQDKNVYTVSDSNIIFTEAPPSGTDNIEVVYLYNYTADREEIESAGYVEAAEEAANIATTKASEASTSEANAATSEANSLQYYTEFFSIYLGQKALDPSVDNNGDALENGMMYYNTTENKLKIWNGSNWLYTGSSNIASVKSTSFTGTGSEVDFDTPENYGDGSQLLVYVSGVYQDQTSYSYSAPTITFNEAPPINSDIQVVYVYTYDGEATQAVLTALVTEAEGYRDEALISKNSAEASATTATTKASEASTSASEALASEQAAATSETNAATSETNAATSETNAATSATNAAASEDSVATNAANAATSEANALTSANNAATSESNASASETSASQSAATATTKASEALTSASNALTSEQAASTSESNAEASEQAAAVSVVNASTSETNAAQSATEASTSAGEALSYKNDAELALDQFTDLYLGAKSSDPTLDNDGDALQVGALYFNTSSNKLNFYNGSTWTPIEFQDIEPVRAESVAFAIALG